MSRGYFTSLLALKHKSFNILKIFCRGDFSRLNKLICRINPTLQAQGSINQTLCVGVLLLLASMTVHAEDLTKQKLRVIALAPHIVESLYAIGAGEQIIGTTSASDYPEAAKQLPRVGSYARLQVEKILQLQPDLIIAWQTGNPPEDLERLKKYKLNVVYSAPQKLADVATELRLLGKLTGREERANQLADSFQSRLQALKSQYQNKMPIKVFYELWSRPLTTVAGSAWPQQQLELCGAENPFKALTSDYPKVGLEQAVNSMPQVVIQPPNHGSNSDNLNWQQWQHIPATQHHLIYHPNADKMHRMTYRMLDEAEALCRYLDGARTIYQPKTKAQ